MDRNWSANNTTHFTLSEYDYATATTEPIAMLPSSTAFTTSYTFALSHNWVVNPTTVLTFRLGAIRDRVFSGSVTPVDDSAWGYPANVVDLLGGTNNGRSMSIGGLSTFGGGSVDDIRDTTY